MEPNGSKILRNSSSVTLNARFRTKSLEDSLMVEMTPSSFVAEGRVMSSSLIDLVGPES